MLLTNTSGCGGVDNVMHDSLVNTSTEAELNTDYEVEAALAVVAAAAAATNVNTSCNTNTCPSEILNTPLHCI